MVLTMENASSNLNIKILIKPCGAKHYFDIHRNGLRKANDKATLTVILRDLFHGRKEAVLFSYSDLSFSRRSKKRQGIVPLQTDRDFHEMHRSLNVKNHLSLYVEFDVAALLQYFMSTIHRINRFESNEKGVFDVQSDVNLLAKNMQSDQHMLFSSQEPFPCDSCNPLKYFREFEGLIHECSICHDVHLCSPCLELGCEVSNHTRLHTMVRSQNLFPDSKQEDSFLDQEMGVKAEREHNISFSPNDYLSFESVFITAMSHTPDLAIRADRIQGGLIKLSLRNLAPEPFRASQLIVELKDLCGNPIGSTIRDSCFILPKMSIELMVKGGYVAPGEKLKVVLHAPKLYAKLCTLDLHDTLGLKSELCKASVYDDDFSVHDGERGLLRSSRENLRIKHAMPVAINGISKLSIGNDDSGDEHLLAKHSELVNPGELDDYDVLSLSDLSEE